MSQRPSPVRARVELQVSTCIMRQHQGVSQFLLVRRSDQHHAFPGMWEFGGGSVEAGETIDQAATREAREELGLAIVRWLPWRTTYHYPKGEDIVHGVRLWAWVKGDPDVRLSWEHTEHRWMDTFDMHGLEGAMIPGILDDAEMAEDILKEWM